MNTVVQSGFGTSGFAPATARVNPSCTPGHATNLGWTTLTKVSPADFSHESGSISSRVLCWIHLHATLICSPLTYSYICRFSPRVTLSISYMCFPASSRHPIRGAGNGYTGALSHKP